ncbi:MAG: hypothetical protein HY711_04765 [Candidatus Melainabacteria bacterium]|nr:hypothetical protein [Candidatus Melainabacteria bacterium]
MFTFLRISSDQTNRVYRQQSSALNSPAKQVLPNKQSEVKPLNPWEKELYRLAARTEAKLNPYSNKAFGGQLPKPRQYGEKVHAKQGTLTDLKIWWGKSMALSSTGSIDLTTFAPPPVKRPNHWYQ